MLKHKRVCYTGEEISRPQLLTLLEIIFGLPPAGAVGIVDPLTVAAGEVREALFDPSLVLLQEAERVGVRPARVHATDEEWNKIGAELLQCVIVFEVVREDAPVVDRQPVLVGAFGVEKRGTPIPPAIRVVRLIVNAIPSNKQQTVIKGDIEQMPVGGEWLHIALETYEIVLWSSDDIQGCFHVLSQPPAWRRWMILSKPIRLAMPAGGAGVLTSNDQVSRGGNATQPVVSDSSRLVWLALAVIPMGWLSAVGVIQHLHRNIISSGRRHQCGLDPDAELVRGKPFLVTLDCSTRWWWKVYVDNFDIGEIFGWGVAAEVFHTESLSQAVYREALNSLGVQRAAVKGAFCEAVGITIGSVIDGISVRAAPTLRKILDHWLLAQPRVCRLWLQAATARLVFDFQLRRPCFAALGHVWKEIVQLHGCRPICTTCDDELLSCICMVPLIFSDMRAQFSSRVFCTDASEFGGGACETIGLTIAGVAATVKKPYGLEVRVQEKFQQKSRPRRWCWGSSGVQTTGALMYVSICSCPSDQTHGLGPRSARKGGIGKSF